MDWGPLYGCPIVPAPIVNGNLFLFIVVSYCLELCLAYSRHPINIQQINESNFIFNIYITL